MPLVMVDRFGRGVTGVRIALTHRCNLRCIYCHHEGEMSTGREMPPEMVIGVARAAADLGVRSVKLTGGEPLLREDLAYILSRIPDEMEVSLTTNGVYLAEKASDLASAGLDRVNVSLDTLRADRYQAITGGREGDMERVLEGIDAANDAGLRPVKLNMVVLRRNEDEVWDLTELSRERGLILQLIELLDLRGLGISGDIGSIERELARRAEWVRTREMHRRRKYFFDGAEVEVVRPMDNTEFCAHCTRLRVTSDGRIKPCLLRNDNLIEIGTCDPVRIRQLLLEANELREPYFRASQNL
ncbi:MAG: GTP 3',8-cyclase MoaA [Methanothrix sp.]|nr:GTP 3',8-cyclase MoaA [Methanothrix sp.]